MQALWWRGLGLATKAAVPSCTSRNGPHQSIMPLFRQYIPLPLCGIPLGMAEVSHCSIMTFYTLIY
ncbi:hypothetical protein ACQPUL_00825 [Clostridium butyricum]